MDNVLNLYHGSKGGIIGKPAPISRADTDFGQALYLGSSRDQSFSLVYKEEKPRYYTATLDLDGLRVLDLNGAKWALFVAFNRKDLEDLDGSVLHFSCKELLKDFDVIRGPIADDKMVQAFGAFTNGYLTLRQLLELLQMYNLGTQYALKSERACAAVSLKEVQLLEPPKAIDKSTQDRLYDDIVDLYRAVPSPTLRTLSTKYRNTPILAIQ